jgi:hypothetical protein
VDAALLQAAQRGAVLRLFASSAWQQEKASIKIK